MKFKEIKGLTVEELNKRLIAAREDYFESKMRHVLGQLSNTNHLREIRRDIGRIQTVLGNRGDRRLDNQLSSSVRGLK